MKLSINKKTRKPSIVKNSAKLGGAFVVGGTIDSALGFGSEWVANQFDVFFPKALHDNIVPIAFTLSAINVAYQGLKLRQLAKEQRYRFG